jgi:GNAT superfamily N-acetyltransferase
MLQPTTDPLVPIRVLTLADAPWAATVIRAAFAAQAMQTDPPSSALKETSETIAALLMRGGGAGAESAGALVGVVLWEEAEGGLYFGRLAVVPQWHGQGLARRLIAAAEAEARRRGLPRAHLSTRLVLADNRRLFAECGYREVRLRSHPGYAEPTFVEMEKLLD